jgi:hypothetical protein
VTTKAIQVVLTMISVGCVVSGCLGRSALATKPAPEDRYMRFAFSPVDEATQDSTLVNFRSRLLNALRSRDIAGVLEATAGGAKQFLSAAAAIGPQAEEWSEIENALALGGSFTTRRGAVPGRREFCAPYVFSAFPPSVPQDLSGELNPAAVVAASVPLRSMPADGTPSRLMLSHELVKRNGESREGGDPYWIGVIAFDGSEGWMKSSEIRYPEDVHVCMAQLDGQWTLTTVGRGAPR